MNIDSCLRPLVPTKLSSPQAPPQFRGALLQIKRLDLTY